MPKTWMPAALLAAFLLHNAEEALTYPTCREQSQALVRSLFARSFVAPDVASFHAALIMVSLVALCAMGWVLLHPDRPLARILVKGLAWVMLLNVFVPHVPAALLLGGYTPGIVSALALNLPIATWVIVATRKSRS